MALIIEDGTGKEDATSYVSAADARAYAAARGATLPPAPGGADPDPLEPMLVQAMDYLEALASRYKGTPTFPAVQALSWPRTGVVINGTELAASGVGSIPRQLKGAQVQLAIEVAAGNDLMPTTDGRVVKKEKVDVIETEFMTGQDLGVTGLPGYTFAKVDALLEPLLASGNWDLKTVRV